MADQRISQHPIYSTVDRWVSLEFTTKVLLHCIKQDLLFIRICIYSQSSESSDRVHTIRNIDYFVQFLEPFGCMDLQYEYTEKKNYLPYLSFTNKMTHQQLWAVVLTGVCWLLTFIKCENECYYYIHWLVQTCLMQGE